MRSAFRAFILAACRGTTDSDASLPGTVVHWLNHNAYARFVTFEDNERLQLSTGVLATETPDELNQLNNNASLSEGISRDR